MKESDMTPLPSDPLLASIIEIDDAIRVLWAVKRRMCDALVQQEATVQKIMAAVRESDEATASFGNSIGMPCAKHAAYIPPGAFCCDVGGDEPE